MTMDKLFDGSDAHLLPGNEALIQRLNEPELHYPGNFDTVKRANAILMCLCQEAADALEAADKRIAKLESACLNYDRRWHEAGYKLDEAERKLDVAREALSAMLSYTAELDANQGMREHEHQAVAMATEALAQIGGDE